MSYISDSLSDNKADRINQEDDPWSLKDHQPGIPKEIPKETL